MRLKTIFIKLYWISAMQFGFDPRKLFKSVYSLPRFIRDYFKFKKLYRGKLELMPCLYDWYEEGGTTKSEYFWQDLLVARLVAEAKPEKHVDVGSRVDGFVTHVASFREIEVFDIRPITTQIPGIIFKQADLMNLSDSYGINSYCDSLSCLHAIEHFGLGRYGDPIDVNGFENGFINMVNLLKPGGTFYLSTPIGKERVEFNSNWVFDPVKIYKLAEMHSMRLQNMINIKQTGERRSFQPTESDLVALSNERYSLGIFHFIKNY